MAWLKNTWMLPFSSFMASFNRRQSMLINTYRIFSMLLSTSSWMCYELWKQDRMVSRFPLNHFSVPLHHRPLLAPESYLGLLLVELPSLYGMSSSVADGGSQEPDGQWLEDIASYRPPSLRL